MTIGIGDGVFGPLVIGYLFCGGIGAGAAFLAAALGLLAPRELVSACLPGPGISGLPMLRAPRAYRRLLAPVFGVASCTLAVGALMLVFDLGVGDRACLIFALPTLTFVTAGAFSLAGLTVASFVLALAWGMPQSLRWNFRVVRVFMWFALVLGPIVMAYTGLLLSAMPAVPLWSSPAMPVLLFASALSCGCALVFACVGFSGASQAFSEVLRRVVAVDLASIVVEAIAAIAFVVMALACPYEVARAGIWELLAGPYSALFFLGFLGAGLIVPFVLDAGMLAAHRCKPLAFYAAAACVFVGGLAVRYCIVMAGAHPQVWTVIS